MRRHGSSRAAWAWAWAGCAVLAASCIRLPASDESCHWGVPAEPKPDRLAEAQAALPVQAWPEEGLVLDTGLCRAANYSTALPLGSAWVLIRPADTACEVWLGGETEDPSYGGQPRQYCRFKRKSCDAPVAVGQGGPARVESGGCLDL